MVDSESAVVAEHGVLPDRLDHMRQWFAAEFLNAVSVIQKCGWLYGETSSGATEAAQRQAQAALLGSNGQGDEGEARQEVRQDRRGDDGSPPVKRRRQYPGSNSNWKFEGPADKFSLCQWLSTCAFCRGPLPVDRNRTDVRQARGLSFHSKVH